MPSLNLKTRTSKFGKSKFSTKPAPLDLRSPANEFAERFYSAWRLTYENVIELGKICIEATKTLEGAELAKFKQLLPFKSWRTAQRLMRIAEHRVLSDATHVSLLPTSWGTLYELSELPEEVVEDLIRKGRINADMERSDANEIVKEYRELGIFSVEKFIKTLNQLILFAKIPAPPVGELVYWLTDEPPHEDLYVEPSDLAKLVPFITQLSEGYRQQLINEERENELKPARLMWGELVSVTKEEEQEQAEPADDKPKPKSKPARLKSRKARRLASAHAGNSDATA